MNNSQISGRQWGSKTQSNDSESDMKFYYHAIARAQLDMLLLLLFYGKSKRGRDKWNKTIGQTIEKRARWCGGGDDKVEEERPSLIYTYIYPLQMSLSHRSDHRPHRHIHHFFFLSILLFIYSISKVANENYNNKKNGRKNISHQRDRIIVMTCTCIPLNKIMVQ